MAPTAVQAPVSYVSPRARFGLIIPATNTVVEAEFAHLLVPGVSWHSGRIEIANPSLADDATMVAFLASLRGTIGAAVDRVAMCLPTALVMGMSAETFWGGAAGAREFEAFMRERSGGLRVTTGAGAARAALEVFGARVLGVVTPYQPVGDEQVVSYFTDVGYEVHQIHGLRCDSATSIAEVHPDVIKDAMRKVDGPGVDAILQTGTNLAAVRVAAEMEMELGKPVIAINAATVWHAYRTNGILDRIQGFGSLLEKY